MIGKKKYKGLKRRELVVLAAVLERVVEQPTAPHNFLIMGYKVVLAGVWTRVCQLLASPIIKTENNLTLSAQERLFVAQAMNDCVHKSDYELLQMRLWVGDVDKEV